MVIQCRGVARGGRVYNFRIRVSGDYLNNSIPIYLTTGKTSHVCSPNSIIIKNNIIPRMNGLYSCLQTCYHQVAVKYSYGYLVTINVLGIRVSTVRSQHHTELIKNICHWGVLSAQPALCGYCSGTHALRL